MNLVYNNDKPIGKCESYSIDKVPGTSPFLMLVDFEQKQSDLNQKQLTVLDWLISNAKRGYSCFESIQSLRGFNSVPGPVLISYLDLTEIERFQVIAAFAEWGMREVAE